MSLSHGFRVIRAQRENVPAFDVLCLLQPMVYLAVLQSDLKAYGSESAVCGCAHGRYVARALRSKWGVTPSTAIVI